MQLHKSPKVKLAHLLFAASSRLKAAGKVLLPRSVVVDALTLPGWYILDRLIFHTTVYKGKVLGIQQESWLMPMPWIEEMERLKRNLPPEPTGMLAGGSKRKSE